jgi:HK97 gp10 family phage protein
VIQITSDFEPKEVARLLKRFGEIEPKVARKLTRKTLKDAARPLKDDMKSRAPVGEPRTVYRNGQVYQTSGGNLRKSVKLRAMGRMNKGNYGVAVSSGRIKAKGTQPDDAFYVYFYEYGTAHQPARPFIRPSVEAHRNRIQKQVARQTALDIIQAAKDRT